MKLFKTLTLIIALSYSFLTQAQKSELSSEASHKTTIDKKTYYQKRAMEDAKYEQQFSAKTKAEEETFWKEQKNYENNLKKKDRKAYKAYMKGKEDAYASHYEHCNNQCHHSDYYYHQTSFYYYGYDRYYYERYPQRNTISTSVQVRTPSVRLGLF
ncbi:hypothetical protein GCM10007962_32420 [Yeosuana aromativorans]|uniref:Uncharacterized protein n=1 Tax=Yeosuana aromativorans TaxID=288019 RepID=A0A8J3BNM5_9FLAO|nr:hypothetical protein [Yeosuana aromativorans]GGK35517.1 hypothetical protein GCM10007962_32420 [Yeosuana aromativorans]